MFVIQQACVGVCDAGCVDVCPVDCIAGPVPVSEIRAVKPDQRRERFAKVQLFIDPDECTGCGACVPECPEEAIAALDELAPNHPDIARNAAFFRRRRSAR